MLYVSFDVVISVKYTELFRFPIRSETLKFVHTQNYTISCVVAGAGGVKYTSRQIK